MKFNKTHQTGVTLLELLVAMAVLVILMAAVFTVIDQTGKMWKRTVARTEQFRSARASFETVVQNLRQATLNVSLEYDNPNHPTTYLRKSDLHFIIGRAAGVPPDPSTDLVQITPLSPYINLPGPTHAVFFQAPIGFSPLTSGSLQSTPAISVPDLLCSLGYFIEFCGDDLQCPAFVVNKTVRYRYRLMEFKEPSANLSVYATSSGTASMQWFQRPLSSATSTYVRPIADNIIALILAPRISSADAAAGGGAIAPNYAYDSRVQGSNPQPAQQNQLPPLVDVVMVAISEDSAQLLAAKYGATPPPIIDSSWFQDASSLSTDLKSLTNNLAKGVLADRNIVPSINYRVFSTTIQLREAK